MKQIDIEKTLSVIKSSGVCEITRKRDMVYKRMYAAVFLRKNTLFSLEKIGSYLGGKEHCSVLHYIKTYQNFKNDELFLMYTKEIADQLNDCFIFGEKKQPLSWLEYAVINCANVKELREIQLKVLDKVESDVEYFELDESLILG